MRLLMKKYEEKVFAIELYLCKLSHFPDKKSVSPEVTTPNHYRWKGQCLRGLKMIDSNFGSVAYVT